MAARGLRKKKILVTGADGFIGSHLTEALVRRGLDVRAFVLYNSFNSWGWLDEAPPAVKRSLDVFAGDIRDPHAVLEAVKDVDVVFHLAALIAIPYSYHAPDSYVETNVRGTLNLLQASAAAGVSKFVHTSTSEVYGTARTVPISESHPLSAQSPYAATKIGADQMALAFHQSFGLPVAVIRPFNTYGPRQSARAIIPTVITQIASGQKSIKLGALHPTRDFNYVDDTVDGFLAVAESAKTVGETVNVGSGFEVTVGQTAEIISRLMKKKVRISRDERRLRPVKSEVNRLCADNRKAHRIAGWSPRYAGLEGFERGLKKTIEWFVRPENLAKYKADLCNL